MYAAAAALAVSVDTSHLDGTQILVAFLGGTAVVSAAVVTAVASLLAARRAGRIEGKLDRLDERVDDIEGVPEVSRHLAAVRLGHVRPEPDPTPP